MSEKLTHPNGTIESATISIPLLKTNDGRPTCALHIRHTNTRCPFLRLQKTGQSGVCVLAHGGIYADTDGGAGFLRPAKDCPIHYTSTRYPRLVTSKEQPDPDKL
ncbi:hypothetical protein UFOVP783_8 [uncultured Caudovirales phage]|uniref:Uncharacterized protein n=1 Tax=uncultured Caudovirales phage TaxID=2100421 RepID=A0A6J5NWG4_9CAUD|nr:hypothetical protein UFOVP783_8 [uncultured Caudovirales phage]